MIPAFIFWIMLALLLTHEMDAMARHEWRVLPLTSFMPEDTGRQIFLWAHVPLYIAIFYFVVVQPAASAKAILSAFAVIHVALHWAFRKHPKYEFNNAASWTLIVSCGLAGAIYLMLEYLQ